MSLKHTLFVLGAGASVEYGYPSGIELSSWLQRQRAFDKDREDKVTMGLLGQTQSLAADPNYNIFFQKFRNCGLNSIDEFLTAQKNKEQDGGSLFLFGKKMLAAHLLFAERLNQTLLARLDRSWYRVLLNELLRPGMRGNDLDIFAHAKFITLGLLPTEWVKNQPVG